MMDFTETRDLTSIDRDMAIKNELEEEPAMVENKETDALETSIPDKKHFEHFAAEIESLQPNTNPTMNIINFYKILFNQVPNLNLDMAEVLKLYKEETKKLKPSTK